MDLFNPGLDTVEPVRPVAPYIGGKKQLSAGICSMIEEIAHSTYAEPFVGMGGVFLRRRRRPKVEVINDISGDVVTLFRILQRHYQAFISEMKFSLSSRESFNRLMRVEPETLTDIERAARFLYLQRLAFGGKVAGRNFGTGSTLRARFNITTLEPMLADLHERLAGVVIERLDWREFLTVYDSPGTLFYLDPPYFGCETDYGKGVFVRADFAEMAARLEVLEGGFILSINDAPEIRETFSAFRQTPVTLTYTIRKGEHREAAELIITNEKASVRR